LKTQSDHEQVQFTAFRHAGADGKPQHTLQLVNKAWPREITIFGIPAEIETLNAVRTSEGEIYKMLQPVKVKDGTVKLELPTQSMLTLTTLEIPALKTPEVESGAAAPE
jgi:hypothetical protein